METQAKSQITGPHSSQQNVKTGGTPIAIGRLHQSERQTATGAEHPDAVGVGIGRRVFQVLQVGRQVEALAKHRAVEQLARVLRIVASALIFIGSAPVEPKAQ